MSPGCGAVTRNVCGFPLEICVPLPPPPSRIFMCNMKVKRVKDDDEVLKYGENCLHFIPSGRRRHWYVRTDTKEALKEWKGVFKVRTLVFEGRWQGLLLARVNPATP